MVKSSKNFLHSKETFFKEKTSFNIESISIRKLRCFNIQDITAGDYQYFPQRMISITRIKAF